MGRGNMEEEAVKMQVPRPSFLGLGRARKHLIFFITAPRDFDTNGLSHTVESTAATTWKL